MPKFLNVLKSLILKEIGDINILDKFTMYTKIQDTFSSERMHAYVYNLKVIKCNAKLYNHMLESLEIFKECCYHLQYCIKNKSSPLNYCY